ncbi:MAG: HlyD family secretion protein, partial [Verrucomicrobia bacterium]|nr:HlyD family secretion protein [Deltaproteobacteria bacterium]
MADDIAAPPQAETTTAEPQQTAAQPHKKRAGGKRNKGIIMLCILIAIGVWLGLRMFIAGKTRIETDNAFIEARIVPVSAKVSGNVMRVLVNDNQFVKKGDLLLEIDPRDYQVQMAKAAAGVGVAENETGGEYLKVEAARAALQSARARHDQAILDLERGKKLFGREVIPKEQLERLKTARLVTESQLKEAGENLKRSQAEAGLGGKSGGRAKVMERKAFLNEAELQLSYTKIHAARDGYITRKSLEAGANIQAGQALMALVPLQDAWITANYKERQITHIRPGQKVEFRVDAYPGRTFTGQVDSIMAGTGAAFS